MKHIITAALTASGLLVMTGCMDRDPYRRTDVWRPTGANAANIAAMVANPQDLIRGRGDGRTDAKASAIAVDRIWTDQPRSMSRSGGSGNPYEGGGTGAGAGGGAGLGATPQPGGG